MRYTMVYVSGGGTEYDGGLWSITKTVKTVTFKCLKQSFFASNCPETMRIRLEKERSHCLRDWGDDTYTVYPSQSGVPHIFTPLTQPLTNVKDKGEL